MVHCGAVEGVKNAFVSIPNWFKNVFQDAWQRVKDVFSKGGEIFTGITDGILNTFKTIVNGLIDGINNVVRQPFEGINNMINSLKNIEIFELKPFGGLNTISIPTIPHLATGIAMAKKGHQYLLEGQGDEAVIPLAKNSEWIHNLARSILNNMAVTSNHSSLSSALNNNSILNANLYAEIVMDKQKVGQVITPVVVKTIRQGGAY